MKLKHSTFIDSPRKKYMRKYYLIHKEDFLENARKQYHTNPKCRERHLKNQRDRRLRMSVEAKREEHIRQKFGENAVIALRNAHHKCIKCGKSYRLAVHHIDGDEENNALENLAVLCQYCHAKLHEYIPVSKETLIEWFKEWMKIETMQF
jgi:DNA-directed RNA polymerase subunit RPC12/RpoP